LSEEAKSDPSAALQSLLESFAKPLTAGDIRDAFRASSQQARGHPGGVVPEATHK
jgi:hypothetical protein